MKLMFNLGTVGLYTAVVSAITIPMVHVHAGLFQDVLDSHLPSNSVPEFKSVSTSFFGRELRRELQIISEECVNKTETQLLEDSVYNETRDANAFACPTFLQASVTWVDADGVVNAVRDYRNCDQSELRAYCQANYQWIDVPDHKIKCPAGEESYQREIYYYDQFVCLVRDPSCPSDSVGLTDQDLLTITNSSECTVEYLEEGHQPPQKPEPKESDNLSEECLDEMAMRAEDAKFLNASNAMAKSVFENCESQINRYTVDDNNFIVYDFNACANQSEYNDFLDAFSYLQPIVFTNRKITCPGNFFFYVISRWDYVGKSCPSDPGDWTGNDMSSTANGLESCTIEPLEEGDEPPSPPTDAPNDKDSPVEAPVEAPSAAASEPLLTKTIALLPAVAAMMLAVLY